MKIGDKYKIDNYLYEVVDLKIIDHFEGEKIGFKRITDSNKKNPIECMSKEKFLKIAIPHEDSCISKNDFEPKDDLGSLPEMEIDKDDQGIIKGVFDKFSNDILSFKLSSGKTVELTSSSCNLVNYSPSFVIIEAWIEGVVQMYEFKKVEEILNKCEEEY